MYPLKEIGTCDPDKTGTKVTFSPDETIFETTTFDFNTLKVRLRETAFLTKNLRITLQDKREDPINERVFHYEGGIKEFVTYLNKGNQELYPEVIYCEVPSKAVFLLVRSLAFLAASLARCASSVFSQIDLATCGFCSKK